MPTVLFGAPIKTVGASPGRGAMTRKKANAAWLRFRTDPSPGQSFMNVEYHLKRHDRYPDTLYFHLPRAMTRFCCIGCYIRVKKVYKPGFWKKLFRKPRKMSQEEFDLWTDILEAEERLREKMLKERGIKTEYFTFRTHHSPLPIP